MHSNTSGHGPLHKDEFSESSKLRNNNIPTPSILLSADNQKQSKKNNFNMRRPSGGFRVFKRILVKLIKH